MKKNLLIGILGGAAVGAAASYLLSSEDRRSLMNGLKNIGEKASDLYSGLVGGEETGTTASAGTASGSTGRGRGSSSGSGNASSGRGSARRG